MHLAQEADVLYFRILRQLSLVPTLEAFVPGCHPTPGRGELLVSRTELLIRWTQYLGLAVVSGTGRFVPDAKFDVSHPSALWCVEDQLKRLTCIAS